ncbi:MAG: UDP-N-acetylglucosamine 2-epimerase [Oscillospiraceae bacterium]|nr:UDP-N-acetylglucosamine 2-epimerase [Oscillospiraceae bacterium]
MKKICIVTGTRAEYGLLKPLIDRIKEGNELTLQLAVTGAHLSPEFGLTYQLIEKDGYHIDEKVEILLSSDTPIGITKSMGLALISFSEAFERLMPDFILILGDRYEILSASIAGMMANIPIIHLYGGETTEGAVDESIRHSITKQSYLHFTSTEEYRKRVIQLGEDPDRVFNVGAIGIKNIKKLPLMSKEELEKSIRFKLDTPFALCTFHPVTLENRTSKEQFLELLNALKIQINLKIIFTKANADADGRIINQLIDDYVTENPEQAIAFESMGQLRYLSAMKYCSFVVGNSSSGIIEAPSLRIPTINIGDRQKGRMQAESVINCKAKEDEILAAIEKASTIEFCESLEQVENPYGTGEVSSKIIRILKDYTNNNEITLKKKFYDLE